MNLCKPAVYLFLFIFITVQTSCPVADSSLYFKIFKKIIENIPVIRYDTIITCKI